jgi:NAD(P)-dependent dehydrogenase (short-subunit alcohol dehydrogenase family)
VVDLAGKVAVVTGAASGIGLALSQRFAAEGMQVVMADVDEARLDQAAAGVGADVLAVRTDAAIADDVDALARRTIESHGAVHVLCNNAGVTHPGPAWEHTREQWEWVLGVNLWGVINGVQSFVPGMIERGDPAHIVNTASVGGLVGFAGLAPYSAAKYAVVGLSESLAHDLRAAGAPVSVSVLCPGPVRTNFRASSRALEPQVEGRDPVPDVVQGGLGWQPPDEIAAKVVDAIRTDRFWILTHPAYNDAIERRIHDALTTAELAEPAFV